MKKALALIMTVVMLLSLCSVFTFAAEEAAEAEVPVQYANPDDSTVRALSFEQNSEHVGYWLNKFDGIDEDAECIGYGAAAFNALAPIKQIVFSVIWAGKSENYEDADIRFEIFQYDTDFSTSYGKTPVYSVERHMDFDKKYENEADKEYLVFKPDETLPAGKYVIRLSQIGTKGPSVTNSRYVVLPNCTNNYSPTRISFDGNSFGFMVDFEKTEGVTEYFGLLSDEVTDFTLDKEITVAPRAASATPYCFIEHHGGEYAILTPAVPEGKTLYSITLMDSPTWVNKEGNSNVDIYVYKWKGDYDSSFDGRCIFEDRIEGHRDNSDLIVTFDAKTLRYGTGTDNRYLIVFQAYEGKIGYYSSDILPEDWAFFGNAGEELEVAPALKCTYASVGDLGPEPTEAPTEVPTAKPTAAPTEEPVITEEPAKTEEAKPIATKAPEKNAAKKDSDPLPIIIIAVCAAIVIACVVLVIVKKSKK